MCIYPGCTRPNLRFPDPDGNHRCISHSIRDGKSLPSFYRALAMLGNNHNFSGFVFPTSFSFERFYDTIHTREFRNSDFSSAEFRCPVDFSNARFRADIKTSFKDARFIGAGDVAFVNSHFLGTGIVDFSNSKFHNSGKVDFSNTKMPLQVEIPPQPPIDRVSFQGAEFFGSEGTDFSDLEIESSRGIDFSGAKFSGSDGVNFFRAKLQSAEVVSFKEAFFAGDGNVDLEKVVLSSNSMIDFGGVEFFCEKGVDFKYCEFISKEVSFIGAKFNSPGKTIFEGKLFDDEAKVDFSNTLFKNPDTINFERVNLNRARFFSVDLRKINFGEVFWTNQKYRLIEQQKRSASERLYGSISRIAQRLREIFLVFGVFDSIREIGISIEKSLEFLWVEVVARATSRMLKIITGDDRIKTHDEEYQQRYFWHHDEKGYRDHYKVKQLYEQLRLNYEESGRYHEAGDFFAGEMEMRRLGDRDSFLIKKILWLYKHLSLYGERPLRIFLFLILFIFSYALLFQWNGIIEETKIEHNYLYTKNTYTFRTFSTDQLNRKKKIVSTGKEFSIPIRDNEYIIVKKINQEKELYFDISSFKNFYDSYKAALSLHFNTLTLKKIETPYVLKNTAWFQAIQSLDIFLYAILASMFILSMNRKFRRMHD